MNGALIEVKPRPPFTNPFLSLSFLLLQRHQPKQPAPIYQPQPHRPEVRFSERSSPYVPRRQSGWACPTNYKDLNGKQVETMIENYDNLEDVCKHMNSLDSSNMRVYKESGGRRRNSKTPKRDERDRKFFGTSTITLSTVIYKSRLKPFPYG
ncbi:hypothetical protein CCUS01_17084 [Colletotrichum cuscutae]|uniref:Uncharacterized protein n=1 Tax=Colletotrichum cuscutae TaxID=1209917 RepID=A0AAI9V967_9PEZI|nr:hypothetical protein CCUS01_17084 [Colletotrichum cuscutae]